jgi:integrase
MPDKQNLTDRTLKALNPAPTGKRYLVWDKHRSNLAVRVTDKGTRTFMVIRRPKGERRLVNHVLGTYPAMSLAEARDAAADALDLLKKGERPLDVEKERRREKKERAERLRADTFEAVAEDFIKRHVKKLRSAGEVAAIVRRDLVSALGDRQVTEIDRRAVVKLIDKINDRRGMYAARHAFATARKLFNWAVERGVLERSPCEGIKAASLHGVPAARDRVLSDDELRRVWSATDRCGYPYGPLVRLLALTGQRRDEIAELRWSEVDLETAVLTIPAGRMKGKIAHAVPLTPTAVEILRGLPRFVSGDFVFTTTGGERPTSGFSKMKARLDRLLGTEVAPWTLHDVRRTVRTGLSSAGVLPVVAELVIGHKQQGIAAVYDLHRYDDEKRDALKRWETKLLSVGAQEGPSDKVVRMRARARS